MKNPYRELEGKLGYRFRRKARLEMALTHRSYRHENVGVEIDNQRLEFLGDAALGLVAASILYETHPDLQEGELTKLRSHLTSSKALNRAAEALDLGAHLRLGRGEQQTGGTTRASNLTDALEAILGAAFLDGGLAAVRRIFEHAIGDASKPALDAHAEDNPKGRLQELVQQRWRVTPKYRMLRETGPSHDRIYTAEVLVRGEVIGVGSGSSKRAAEMAAACVGFQHLCAPPDSPTGASA